MQINGSNEFSSCDQQMDKCRIMEAGNLILNDGQQWHAESSHPWGFTQKLGHSTVVHATAPTHVCCHCRGSDEVQVTYNGTQLQRTPIRCAMLILCSPAVFITNAARHAFAASTTPIPCLAVCYWPCVAGQHCGPSQLCRGSFLLSHSSRVACKRRPALLSLRSFKRFVTNTTTALRLLSWHKTSR